MRPAVFRRSYLNVFPKYIVSFIGSMVKNVSGKREFAQHRIAPAPRV